MVDKLLLIIASFWSNLLKIFNYNWMSKSVILLFKIIVLFTVQEWKWNWVTKPSKGNQQIFAFSLYNALTKGNKWTFRGTEGLKSDKKHYLKQQKYLN